MKVRVVCYEGYKAEETPRAFHLGERRVEGYRWGPMSPGRGRIAGAMTCLEYGFDSREIL